MDISTNLTALINIWKTTKSVLSGQGLNMTNHGYSNFTDDIDGLFTNIHTVIGDVEDGGASMTITEKLNRLIDLANQALYGDDPDEGRAETVSDAVLQLIQKIEELEGNSQDNT